MPANSTRHIEPLLPGEEVQPSRAKLAPFMLRIPFGMRFRKVPRPTPQPDATFSETPNPGGVIASGNAATVEVPGTTGGAGIGGNAPTGSTAAQQGGATDSGNAPTAAVNCSPGGASGGGTGGTAQTDLTPGGAVVGGNAPTEDILQPTPTFRRKEDAFFLHYATGGFRKLRRSPIGTTTIAPVTQETPNPGGAIVSGNAPDAQVPAVTGGTTANGNTPQASTSLAQGGAVLAGPNPSGAASGVPGGSVAGGNGETAAVGFNPGGLTTGGLAPSEIIDGPIYQVPKNTLMYLFKVFPRARARLLKKPLGTTAEPVDHETPNPGGAIVSGFSPTAQVGTNVGGATINGNAPTTAANANTGGAVVNGLGGTATTSQTTPGGLTVNGNAVIVAVPLVQGGTVVGGNTPFVNIAVLPRKEPIWFFVWGVKAGYIKLPTRGPKAAIITPPQPRAPYEPTGTISVRPRARGSIKIRTKGKVERVR